MRYQRIIGVMLCLLVCTLTVRAQQNNETIAQLQSEMYKYFSSPEQEKFFEITEQLKTECLKVGNEQLFYKAWANQAIYESTHEHRNHASEIAKKMMEYAKENNSRFGEYTALHAMGSVYLRMVNYEEAESTFLEAINTLHRHFPGQSAAADYLELVTIANRRNDQAKGKKYAQMVLREPGLQPQHKIRAYSMLCQYAFLANNREEYNRLYNEWEELLDETAGGSLESTVKTEYLVINGRYEDALKESENIPIKTRAEIQATIYHRMGDDGKAYQYLQTWNHVRDSINRADQVNLFSDYIVQAQNERLENERLVLEEQNRVLRVRFLLTLVLAIVVILALVIYQRHKTVKRLRQDNKDLDDARNEAEKARNEAEKALDVKREFLNNISHELRTPLNPITGMSDILTTTEYNLQPEERQMMSEHIKDNSKLLTRIIDNMIELSFYESKHALPQEDVISPNVICRSMIDATEHLCPENVRLECATSIPNNLKISTNLEGVNKILKHLLDNSFQHTEKGTITIECAEQDGFVNIAVADTGSGVKPDLQDHVFDMFVMTGDGVKTTGMGLSICQAILKLLGGRIWLDMEYKQGARFVFSLPVKNNET